MYLTIKLINLRSDAGQLNALQIRVLSPRSREHWYRTEITELIVLST